MLLTKFLVASLWFEKYISNYLIFQVNQSHQGRYSCTPYNRHTTAGSSGDMEVIYVSHDWTSY